MEINSHLTLVEPVKVQADGRPTQRDQNLVALREWVESGPGVMTGSTPAKMMIAAQRSFAKFSGQKLNEKSTGLEILDNGLNALGYRGGSVIFGGEVLWLLVLPQKKR